MSTNEYGVRIVQHQCIRLLKSLQAGGDSAICTIRPITILPVQRHVSALVWRYAVCAGRMAHTAKALAEKEECILTFWGKSAPPVAALTGYTHYRGATCTIAARACDRIGRSRRRSYNSAGCTHKPARPVYKSVDDTPIVRKASPRCSQCSLPYANK